MLDQMQSLEEFCREMEARRKAVGMSEDDDWEIRDLDQRRMAEKREFLRRIVERGCVAGTDPFPANYSARLSATWKVAECPEGPLCCPRLPTLRDLPTLDAEHCAPKSMPAQLQGSAVGR
jgi:hypothetical protein